MMKYLPFIKVTIILILMGFTLNLYARNVICNEQRFNKNKMWWNSRINLYLEKDYPKYFLIHMENKEPYLFNYKNEIFSEGHNCFQSDSIRINLESSRLYPQNILVYMQGYHHPNTKGKFANFSLSPIIDFSYKRQKTWKESTVNRNFTKRYTLHIINNEKNYLDNMPYNYYESNHNINILYF
ncbi:hypothetical protein CF386_08900 [Paraphotobacterium marinum]|uniref:Uncharacterized protein n=1 Tax=Paraphotobacterium marinum TaxID=1755811 RepID=A0A220VFI6_9GAMM|nr:hypothetical protein [Paraphotobacterium marinum]ASK79178.1 hypothetical protein CF386_08900 [Paraphotobacterium marinum]